MYLTSSRVYRPWVYRLVLLSGEPIVSPLEQRSLLASLRYQSKPARDLFSSRLKPRIDVLRSLVLPILD